MAETLAQRHIRIYESMKSARASLESYWQDLVYYALPRKAYITKEKYEGSKIPTDIYDSTAIVSLAYFAAGMQAYMSSPQTKWFALTLRNQKLLAGNKEVRDYLKDSEDELYHLINGSNFYQEDVESYLNLGSVGTDVLYSEEDIKGGMRFDSVPIENICIAADAQGRVNKAYMEYTFDCEQAIGKFGNAVGQKAKDCYNKSDFNTKFRYIFCVFPRNIYNPTKKDAINMPYAALWIDRETKTVVREKGYREFPFHGSRFAKSKLSAYGASPEMNVLPDIMMLNQIEKTNILGAQMSILPPLEIPDEAFLKPYNFNPGGKNLKATGYPNEHITPVNTGANVPLGIDYIKYKQETVQKAFYNDLFILFQQIGKMTAFEVSVRNNQRMQLLGSAIGNVMREKLSPVIERGYSILARSGRLPPLPPSLRGEDYVIEYISPLARAQKALELQNFTQAFDIIAGMAQVNPDVLDKIDFDEAVDYVTKLTNTTPKVIRDDAEVDEIRQNRAEGQALLQQMEMMKQGTEAVKVGSEADKNLATAETAGAK